MPGNPINQIHSDCDELNTSSQYKGGDVDLTHVVANIEISAERDAELNSGNTEVEAEDRRDLSNTADVSVQCHSLLPFSARCSHRNFENNPAAMQYYTSFHSHEHFMFFFHVLGPAAYHLKKFSSLPNPTEQLFLTLMKLRQAKEDLELSLMFQLSTTTVGEIFNIWVNFLFCQLREIDVWPSGDIISENMPQNFARLFPNTKNDIGCYRSTNTEATSCGGTVCDIQLLQK